MPPFRRVEGKSAGASALGILVPPGRRTLVVLRPRSLDWDLVLATSPFAGEAPAAFWEGDRRGAMALAEELHRALGKVQADPTRAVEVVTHSRDGGLRVLAAVERHRLIVCGRVPGRPYAPMTFASAEDAQNATAAVAAVLSPGPEANQEVYLNIDCFTR